MKEIDNGCIYFRLDPKDTNYINRIIEGYEYMGTMSTVDKKEGIALLRSTEDMKPLALEVLATLAEVKEVL